MITYFFLIAAVYYKCFLLFVNQVHVKEVTS